MMLLNNLLLQLMLLIEELRVCIKHQILANLVLIDIDIIKHERIPSLIVQLILSWIMIPVIMYSHVVLRSLVVCKGYFLFLLLIKWLLINLLKIWVNWQLRETNNQLTLIWIIRNILKLKVINVIWIIVVGTECRVINVLWIDEALIVTLLKNFS